MKSVLLKSHVEIVRNSMLLMSLISSLIVSSASLAQGDVVAQAEVLEIGCANAEPDICVQDPVPDAGGIAARLVEVLQVS